MNNGLTKRIKSKAIELGLSEIGIASADSPGEEGARLLEWLSLGYHASMQWMQRDREKRADPQQVLPQVKSIICVAMNYYTSTRHSDNPETGKISRYAWGDDYHLVLTKRLEELQKFIQTEIPEVQSKIYVDTGPVMDKAWAAKAGLGWMGKHTNIITRSHGSWVFLGEILLDVELEYDKPMRDMCGTCTACIDACPTKAIVQPYVLDSNKCISYLTIEHRGDIPQAIIPQLDRWIYGCDICQDVCPWNRFPKETREPAFQPRESNIAPNLKDLAGISHEEFTTRFHKSPIKRTKQTGLVRNVKAVLESQKTSK